MEDRDLWAGRRMCLKKLEANAEAAAYVDGSYRHGY